MQVIAPAGTVFNRFTLLEDKVPSRRRVRVMCECGTIQESDFFNLAYGKVKSCGCLTDEVRPTIRLTHGMSKNKRRDGHPLYSVWQSMKQRCYDENQRAYQNYGGRGITVCDEWRESFPQFLADMGERPEGYSLDRIDNDGPYAPWNCRWADKSTQGFNQRIRPGAIGPCSSCGSKDPKGRFRKHLCSPCYMRQWASAHHRAATRGGGG